MEVIEYAGPLVMTALHYAKNPAYRDIDPSLLCMSQGDTHSSHRTPFSTSNLTPSASGLQTYFSAFGQWLRVLYEGKVDHVPVWSVGGVLISLSMAVSL